MLFCSDVITHKTFRRRNWKWMNLTFQWTCCVLLFWKAHIYWSVLSCFKLLIYPNLLLSLLSFAVFTTNYTLLFCVFIFPLILKSHRLLFWRAVTAAWSGCWSDYRHSLSDPLRSGRWRPITGDSGVVCVFTLFCTQPERDVCTGLHKPEPVRE